MGSSPDTVRGTDWSCSGPHEACGESATTYPTLLRCVESSMSAVAELFAGIRGDEEKKALDQLLQGFIILPVTEKVARLSGLHRRDYRPSHGTGLADALIAATAEENGADLATFNRRHFPMVSRIEVPYER